MKKDEFTHHTSVIILAAGESLRMKEHNKLLLPFRRKTVLEATLSAFLPLRFPEIIVVLGHEAEKLAAVLQPYPVKTVINENYRSGMGGSIATGVSAASASSEGILVCAGDLPLLKPATVELLCQIFSQHTPPVIVFPSRYGQQGHPVIFSRDFLPALLRLHGDRGARGIVQANKNANVEVSIDSDEILFDLDTEEKYRELLQREAHEKTSK